MKCIGLMLYRLNFFYHPKSITFEVVFVHKYRF